MERYINTLIHSSIDNHYSYNDDDNNNNSDDNNNDDNSMWHSNR